MPIFYVLSFIFTESAGELIGLSISATYTAIWVAFVAVFAAAVYLAWRHPAILRNGNGRAFCLSLDPEH